MKTKTTLLGTLILAAAVVVGCGGPNTGASTKAEMEFTERNQVRLQKRRPPPELNDSLERQNLIKRLELFNNPDKLSYIYLISHGKVMARYPIKGKVTYASSKLTTRDQIISIGGGGAHYSRHEVESPGLDGSYGPSEDAIFFFTTEGVYVEWKGDYMLCDQPLKLSTPPELIRVMETKKKKTKPAAPPAPVEANTTQ